MDNFAFMIHPVHGITHTARESKPSGHLLESWIDFFFGHFPAIYVSHIAGVRSRIGKEIEGWLVSCPPTTARSVKSSPEFRERKIIQTGRLAQRLGARIVGLGDLTTVVSGAESPWPRTWAFQ